MPQWIHDRAKHIRAKNPDMPESEAFAIATQQSHATGHSPKGYGTSEGRHEAKKKYTTPDDDVQTANPHEKTAGLLGNLRQHANKAVGKAMGHVKNQVLEHAGKAVEQVKQKIEPHAAEAAKKIEEHVASTAKKHVEKELAPHISKAKRYGAVAAGVGAGLTGLNFAAHYRTNKALKRIEQKLSPKTKTAGITTPFSSVFVGGFCNELTAIFEKRANLLPPPPTGLAQVKSTIPKPATSVQGRHSVVAKVHSTPPESPALGHQPVADAPQVRT